MEFATGKREREKTSNPRLSIKKRYRRGTSAQSFRAGGETKPEDYKEEGRQPFGEVQTRKKNIRKLPIKTEEKATISARKKPNSREGRIATLGTKGARKKKRREGEI